MTKAPSIYKLQKSVYSLIGAGCFLVFLYIALVSLTFSNTLQRQNAELAIQKLTAETAELEFSYLKQTSSLTLSFAKLQGFVETDQVTVLRSSDAVSLR